ncbi:MAG: hypothetical protein LUH12_08395, partial [Bacteroides sp.]|nr:hypothetical protein [Bacteroides sp.]
IIETNNRLEKNKSLDEQSLKLKLRIENELEWTKNMFIQFDSKKLKRLKNKSISWNIFCRQNIMFNRS